MKRPPTAAETEQGAFWRGAFGDAYSERNASTAERVTMRERMWRRVLAAVMDAPPASVLEVGANVGVNLQALARLLPGAALSALEPNATARATLAGSGVVPPERIHDAFGDAIPLPDRAVEMAFTCGVLIHVAPDRLLDTYRELYRVASRWLVTIEYFSDRAEEVLYRGHAGKLFKRDFGAVWLDHFPGVELVDYGFFWKPATGLDNLTWWLFRKP
mgnify:CR=1 FL=1|jgi:pseudaminic acid biosynthesis-associated methylase